MRFRSWITIVTVILLGLVVFLARKEILHAWSLLGSVNVWILALVIPVQFLSYYAVGGMIFSYLRAKGNLKETSQWQITRMALELNFVNHIFPSGGAAGFSYLGWVLGRHGVSAGRATIAQIIRFVLTFVSFIILLLISVLILTFDHNINRTVIVISLGLTLIAIAVTFLIIYVIGSQVRLVRFSGWLTRVVNNFVAKVTRGKNPHILILAKIEGFFEELHQDYLSIRRDNTILIRPFAWSMFAMITDIMLFYICFLALGTPISPATLTVAIGVSAIASLISVAPGGAGVYEAVMIAFLASAHVPADVAIAGTLLARVTLVLGTIIFGYVFYQLTIVKYGKRPTDS